MMLFLLMALTTINLYSIHETLISQDLKGQSTYLIAEELFYTARNFETDFQKTVTSPETLIIWYNNWSTYQQPPTFGYFSQQLLECIQVEENFNQFASRVFRFKNNSAFMEDYMAQESCIFLPLEKGGFKTFGVLLSPICTNCN